jgi:hypothetical protein
MTLSVSRLYEQDDELESIWNGSGCRLIEVLSWNLPGGIEENHEISQSE